MNKNKQMIFFSVILITIGSMMNISENLQITFKEVLRLNPSVIGLISLLFGIAALTLAYLQSSNNDPLGVIPNKYVDEIELLKEQIKLHEDSIINLAEKNNDSKKGLSEEEKNIIIEKIVKNSSEESIKTIFKEESKILENDFKNVLGLNSLKKSFEEIIHRLKREVNDLRLRANVNLVIGGIITIGGLYFLWTTVGMIDNPDFLKHDIEGKIVKKEFSEIILSYAPRILLVIFIETFAYFFLRLYKLGLDDIKYFQNELTNLESKLISVEVAYITKNEESLKNTIKILANTERNFILKKGETTVELEKARSNSKYMQSFIKNVPNLLKKA